MDVPRPHRRLQRVVEAQSPRGGGDGYRGGAAGPQHIVEAVRGLRRLAIADRPEGTNHMPEPRELEPGYQMLRFIPQRRAARRRTARRHIRQFRPGRAGPGDVEDRQRTVVEQNRAVGRFTRIVGRGRRSAPRNSRRVRTGHVRGWPPR